MNILLMDNVKNVVINALFTLAIAMGAEAAEKVAQILKSGKVKGS